MPANPESSGVSTLFPIAGIGASAGGLDAFLDLFKALRPPTGVGFVLVTHLEPHHESQLAGIVGGTTSLPVIQVKEPIRVEPDHIYILPPDAHITIREGVLQLQPRAETQHPYYPI